jgi:DNA-binding transcriptional ArsR family regulator
MPDPNARRLLWYLFAGSKGGDNRIKIIDLLKERPYNINQLAEALRLDYKAIQHHIVVLEKNNLVSKTGEKYGILYFISNYLEANHLSVSSYSQRSDQAPQSTLSHSIYRLSLNSFLQMSRNLDPSGIL